MPFSSPNACKSRCVSICSRFVSCISIKSQRYFLISVVMWCSLVRMPLMFSVIIAGPITDVTVAVGGGPLGPR